MTSHDRTDLISPAAESVMTLDGREITSRLFQPAGKPQAAVLIVPAMGASQSFYRALAAWLARQGFLAATFDYRGIGQSRREPLRDLKADIIDWARYDCAAVIEPLGARLPGKPLYWIGHSLGGQILPFVPNWRRLAKVVTIAAGSGYWRENSPRLKRYVWWLWYVLVPLSARNTESLHRFYVGAPRVMKRLAPRDVGARRIGPFGFFRPSSEQILWRPYLLPELV
jgi:predicted alpha/beta hydrolase